MPKPFKAKKKHQAMLRIDALMQEHGYRFDKDLWRALSALGIDISYSQLTRVVKNSSKHLNVDLLEGFATIFNCKVSELFSAD